MRNTREVFMSNISLCKIPECPKNARYSGVCTMHYTRYRRHKSYDFPPSKRIRQPDIYPTGIVRICEIHGELAIDHVYIRKNGLKLCRKCQNRKTMDNTAKRRKTDPQKQRLIDKHWRLIRKFNITLDQYYQMLAKQNNCCAICKNPETRIDKRTAELTMLAVDHCHKTQKVRGLLCAKCNQGIGYFNDNIESLESAAQYLKLY